MKKQTTIEAVLAEIGKIVREGIVNVLITNDNENAPLLVVNPQTITQEQLGMILCLANKLCASTQVEGAP